ncbi:MAG: [FeFe] hydrogenase H-cluster maturation GTPase HydF [Pseudomonadota bacterium]
MMKNQRPHIGIFGKRNVGKSSFINAITGQDISIVSGHPGTTTDPVDKIIELEDVGPVVLIDTAGIDDAGALGEKRIEATRKIIKKIDLGIILFEKNDYGKFEEEIIEEFKKHQTPFFIIHNKSDLKTINSDAKKEIEKSSGTQVLDFSSTKKTNLKQIMDAIKKHTPESAFQNISLLDGLVEKGDIVLMITPLDSEAPRGRMILPEGQTLIDVLNKDCIAITVKETEVELYFQKIKVKPRLVVTDSQAFKKVAAVVPKDIPLTSFSILFSRLKGDFKQYIEGVKQIDKLKDGDNILILESCSHHVTHDDIGRVKIPKWLKEYTGKNLNFEVVAGTDNIPQNKKYALAVQCGGCMLTQKQVLNRIKTASDSGVPVTNYGMLIAYVNGIFERAIKPFHSGK